MKALCAVSLVLLVGGALGGGSVNMMPSHLHDLLFTHPGPSPLTCLADLGEAIGDKIGDTIREHEYPVTFDTILPGVAMLDGILPVSELPTLKWVAGVLDVFLKLSLSTLEQKESDLIKALATDKMEIKEAMQKVHDAVEAAKGVLTKSNSFELAGNITVVMRALQPFVNQSAVPIDTPLLTAVTKQAVNTIAKLFDVFLTPFMTPDNARPARYSGYPKLFDPLLQFFPEPETNWEIGVDEAFSRQRVAGYVPFQLRKVEPKLLHEMHFRQYRGKCRNLISRVEKALSEGRLYGTDYSQLAEQPRQEGKFAAPVVGLFEIPEDEEEGKRVGMKVLCVQVTKGVATSIFTPSDSEWVWKYAKMVFNGMEAVYHEGIAHLGDTHLVVETMLLSLKRVVSPKHPLRQLVDPHLEGTALINWLAEKVLMVDDGPFDKLFPTKIGDIRSYICDHVLERLDQNLTWPAFMEAAGMTEEQFPAKYYPYRDYAGRLWTAYHRWVGRYLRLVYPDDTALNGDRDIEQFRRELIANKVGWVEKTWAENEGTVALLTDVVTSFIFIGSTQHAAVNFAQLRDIAPAGWAPMSTYSHPASSAEQVRFEGDVIHSLPTVSQALLQRDLTVVLSPQYTSILDGYADPQFDTSEIVRAAKDFHQDLVDIERYQKDQNKEAVLRWQSVNKPEGLDPDHWAYTLLLPSLTPMSINI